MSGLSRLQAHEAVARAHYEPLAETLRAIGRAATVALYHELALAPKPGLVSFVDNGSHDDMDAGTFMRSLFALRTYFPAITHAGAEAAPFARLEQLGLEAERRMLAATGGINTHRGAIFALGLLCAAAGLLAAHERRIEPETLRETLQVQWGPALRARAARSASMPARSKGQQAARAWGLRSAGDEAADAFPVLFDVTFPALCAAQAFGADGDPAMVHALFATIRTLDDTNLAHRGGIEGLRLAQFEARGFLVAGSVFSAGWRARALALHQRFVLRRLSPGGAADMLACAWWLDRVSRA